MALKAVLTTCVALVLAMVGACASAADTAASAQPSTPASARELHAADCVAALQVNTEALAAKVKAGDEGSRALLQSKMEAGTAFVGDTYLHEDRDEAHARGLANAALDAQKRLSPAQLAARQTACADEGAALLANANGLERLLVRKMARKRMDKLLSN